MKQYKYLTADVFTSTRFGGNPLAVVLDAAELNDAHMQKIAREFNYSETTFVSALAADENNTPRFAVRIFTPARELPFAGHPTIGTAAVLAHTGLLDRKQHDRVILQEGVGPVVVQFNASGAWLTAAQPIRFSPAEAPSRELLARVLSLEPEDIGTVDARGHRYHTQGASTGIPSLNVPVRNREVLGRARIRQDVWEEQLQSQWAPDPYLFCFDPEDAGNQIRARKFAMTAGVGEDPATGSAATTLAGYLAQHDPVVQAAENGRFEWRIEQGYEMGRPSLLVARAEKSRGIVSACGVGGDSVIVCEGTLRT